ncbi:DNA binding protein [Fragilaria crotonensis]|nr:DNA binding protein [Fragilaria crotonensis]
MEQRIQQLTQSLSRIGRVLDHHREKTGSPPTSDDANPESVIHPPLSIMTDHEVVAWMWSDDAGVVKSLLRSIQREQCAPTLLYESLAAKVKEYRKLSDFVANPKESGILFLEARRTLTAALLDLRECLNDGIRELAKEFKKKELERGRIKSKARREEAKGAVTREVNAVLQSVVNQVVCRFEDPCGSLDTSLVSKPRSPAKAKGGTELSASPWLEYYHDRWKLEAAADILLLYARTTTFFKINPYAPVKSTSLEVYARELGNNIPLSTIRSVRDEKALPPSNIQLLGEPTGSTSHRSGEDDAAKVDSTVACSAIAKKKKPEVVCDPDAVLANVTVSYSGDYVFSQLLQWFNGGIGQKQGLPDMIGCVILPSVEATFASSGGSGGKTQKTTLYRSQVRPRLFDWLRDPHQRGSTFPDELANVFKGPELKYEEGLLLTLPIGSPILDLLIMGDDANINAVLTALDHDRLRDVRTGTSTDTATTRLESTIDEAMPAQAVAKWVQCENEGCLKWRRLPFFVDVDVLPEQFFCRDNVWNPEAQNCDAPEDTWDDCDNQLHNEGIEKESDKEMQSVREGDGDREFQVELQYAIGDRYDVLRTKKKCFVLAKWLTLTSKVQQSESSCTSRKSLKSLTSG